MLLLLGVFFLALLDDILAASYIQAVSSRPIRAAFISSVIVLVGNLSIAFAVPQYNYWVIPPEMAGAGLGTWLVARRGFTT